MSLEHQESEVGRETQNLMSLFGIECLIERLYPGTRVDSIKISCKTEADAEAIVRNFWKEYDPRLFTELESGKVKFDGFGEGPRARTGVIRQSHQDDFKCIILINQNGNPLRQDTKDVLIKGGLTFKL